MPTPELGRIATTWAAGQAAELNQWALELWRATEEKRAALVALRRSEETLHQVWQQLRHLWPGPPIEVQPAGPRQGETPGSPAMGGREVKHRSRRKQAGTRVTTNLLERRATGVSEPHDEPPAEQGTSCPGERSWGSGERGPGVAAGAGGDESEVNRGSHQASRGGAAAGGYALAACRPPAWATRR